MDEVLSRLLRDVLGAPIERAHPRSALEQTALILADTAEIVGSELLSCRSTARTCARGGPGGRSAALVDRADTHAFAPRKRDVRDPIPAPAMGINDSGTRGAAYAFAATLGTLFQLFLDMGAAGFEPATSRE